MANIKINAAYGDMAMLRLVPSSSQTGHPMSNMGPEGFMNNVPKVQQGAMRAPC